MLVTRVSAGDHAAVGLPSRVMLRWAKYLDLAHNLEISVVAEGIEDLGTLGILRDMGCDTGQGYLFGRPMAIDKLDRWLARHAPDGLFLA